MSDQETEQKETDPLEELTSLRAANASMQKKMDELLGETKDAKRKTREAEERVKTEAEELARKSGDVAALEKSWNEKYTKREQELLDNLQGMHSKFDKIYVDNVAIQLASELSIQGSADILMPHIKSRLKTEMRDGEYVTVVMDKSGQPSAATLQELKNEFIGNAAFAPIIAGSKASGGGSTGQKSGSAASKTMSRSAFNTLDYGSRANFVKDGGTLVDNI